MDALPAACSGALIVRVERFGWRQPEKAIRRGREAESIQSSIYRLHSSTSYPTCRVRVLVFSTLFVSLCCVCLVPPFGRYLGGVGRRASAIASRNKQTNNNKRKEERNKKETRENKRKQTQPTTNNSHEHTRHRREQARTSQTPHRYVHAHRGVHWLVCVCLVSGVGWDLRLTVNTRLNATKRQQQQTLHTPCKCSRIHPRMQLRTFLMTVVSFPRCCCCFLLLLSSLFWNLRPSTPHTPTRIHTYIRQGIRSNNTNPFLILPPTPPHPTPSISMSSAKPTSSVLNPKRASGEALNPKRASGGALKPTAASTAATSSSLLKKKTPVETATKGVAGLKVGGDSPPAGSRRIAAVSRRRGDDDAPAPAASSSAVPSSSASASTSLSAVKANQARRRLSITAGKDDASKLDGHSTDDTVKDPLTKVLKSMAASNAAPAQAAAATSSAAVAAPKPKKRIFSHYVSLSKVGHIPFNPNKVNQDRTVEIVKFGNSDDKAFFGCFDGHGSVGHEVSSFLIQELPKFFLKQANLDSNPHEAISKAFVDCNVKLASSAIDCTFSGSTGIVVYLANGKIYGCNAGDSVS